MKNNNITIAYTTHTYNETREGTLEAKLRIAAEQASATEKAAADKEAAEKANRAMSLADRNAKAQAEAAERKLGRRAARRAAEAAAKEQRKAEEAAREAARQLKREAAIKEHEAPTKATSAEIRELSERLSACYCKLENLNEKLEGLVVERSELSNILDADNIEITSRDRRIAVNTKRRDTVCADIANLKRILRNIKREYSDDPAMLAIIDAAIKDTTANMRTSRPEKTTKITTLKYRAAVIKPQNLFDPNVFRAVKALYGYDKYGHAKAARADESDEDARERIRKEANAALDWLENYFEKLESFPVLDAKHLETRVFAQSQTSDIVGIRERGLQKHVVCLDHNLWAMFNVPNAEDRFVRKNINGEELNGRQRLERLTKTLITRFEVEGFDVKFMSKPEHYISWCYSNSGLKEGTGMYMNQATYNRHRAAFMYGLDQFPATNGQEQYKLAAVFNTPSVLNEYKWTDDEGKVHVNRLHMRDIIMLKAIQLKLPLRKGSITVGEGSDVAVTIKTNKGTKRVTLPITINPDGAIELKSVDGFDGMILVNDPNFDSFQGRATGMKFLAVNVYGMLDELVKIKPQYAEAASKPICIKDMDGNEKLFREGSMITTDTTWKSKKLFDKWSDFLANCEKLAKQYDGYDCLRIVSMPDDYEEMVRDRHTSRQLLAQFIGITDNDARLLIESTAMKTASMRTVSGALHHLAGLGLSNDSLTQTEQLFRLLPHLVGNDKIQQFMLNKMHDQLATLACCELPTREVSALMAQDPAAMLEIMLFGADPEDENLGLLKEDEFCSFAMRDGKESVHVRYPANGQTAAVKVNHLYDAYRMCGNIIVLNIHDEWIIDNDGDCDGDHVAAYESNWLVGICKRNEMLTRILGLNRTVLFEHGEGAKKAEATEEWMAKGRVEAVYNGMVFNFVGRFSTAAMWAWTKVSEFYRANDRKQAYEYGMLANLFAVAAILTIDWCKTGVPAEGTVGRDIFDAAMELLDYAGDFSHGHAYGAKPWAQMFRDHGPEADFVTLSQPESRMSQNGNPYSKHKYGAPVKATINNVAMMVMNDAGIDVHSDGCISRVNFEMTSKIDIAEMLGIEPATIVIDGNRVAAKNAQNGIVRSRVMNQINPNRFDPEQLESADDRHVAEAIANGEKVSVLEFARFCFRLMAELDRSFAKEYQSKLSEFSAAETKQLVYAATRSMLHSMIDDTPWSYNPGIIDPMSGKTNGQMNLPEITDHDRKWQIIVDTILRDAFELGKNNTIGSSSDNAEVIQRKKAKYAMFALNVFAPDLLNRAELALGAEQTADLSFLEIQEVRQHADDEGLIWN